MVSRVVLDLVERVGLAAAGDRVEMPVAPLDEPVVAAWCERTGNELIEIRNGVAVLRRGPVLAHSSVLSELPPDHRPGARLWLYTNFDCNLACDYCCARSSPHAARRKLGVDLVRRLVAEGADAGVRQVFITGGEPFLLLDLDSIVAECASRLPTTVLTNGMLFRGRRLAVLRQIPRDGVALQVSVDSATPELHDLHRGKGSWQRAMEGVRIARAEGFRVRVAATVAAGETNSDELAAFHRLLDDMEIPTDDRIVRPVAQRGFADSGVTLSVESLVPEVTVAVDGVYWHPVGVDHDDQLVTREIFPLADAIAEVQRRFVEHRRSAAAAAQQFTCA